ncbi:MAG TPA: hypothetical protein VJN21_15320 [Candidatus Acidoferrales bacterium]|nr:hypothetical protein [Candidatus Acidoferrales bacterium]
MNRAFLIIAIPAFIVSFAWLAFGYGWRVALAVVVLELAAAIGGVVYLRRRGSQTAGRGGSAG